MSEQRPRLIVYNEAVLFGHGGDERAEAFRIACHELVSLDFRCGSQPEVSDGHENVGFRGYCALESA